MAFDEVLASRIRELLIDESEVTERKMFGGVAFLVNNKMAVTASGRGGVMVRVDPKKADALVATSKAVPAEMRGRTMRGWLRIGADDLRTKRQLSKWVGLGVSYAHSLSGNA